MHGNRTRARFEFSDFCVRIFKITDRVNELFLCYLYKEASLGVYAETLSPFIAHVIERHKYLHYTAEHITLSA